MGGAPRQRVDASSASHTVAATACCRAHGVAGYQGHTQRRPTTRRLYPDPSHRIWVCCSSQSSTAEGGSHREDISRCITTCSRRRVAHTPVWVGQGGRHPRALWTGLAHPRQAAIAHKTQVLPQAVGSSPGGRVPPCTSRRLQATEQKRRRNRFASEVGQGEISTAFTVSMASAAAADWSVTAGRWPQQSVCPT